MYGHLFCIYLAECNVFYSVFCYLINKLERQLLHGYTVIPIFY